MRRIILRTVAFTAVRYISTLSNKRVDFVEKKVELKIYALISSKSLKNLAF
jgi:hypothetical protein